LAPQQTNSSAETTTVSRGRALAFAAVVALIAVPLGFAHDGAYRRVDSEWYLLIAQGRTAEAIQPFTARQLDPLLARAISAGLHVNLLSGFLAVGLASLFVTALLVGGMLSRRGAGTLGLVSVAALYFWPALFGSFMLPDTLSAALLACFLFCLWKEQWLWAAACLMPMFVARESTILVLLCLLAVGWQRLRWPVVSAALAASAAGLAIVRSLSAHGMPNREHLNPLLYMVGKIPWNFFANVFAMQPWSAAVASSCAVPRYSTNLPFGLKIGGSALVGLCGWDPAWQANSLLVALCSFGLLPLVTVYLLRYHRASLWTDDLFTRFCVIYGGLCFLIAPLLGHTVERLFLYGWPIFLLVTPVATLRAFGSANWKSGLVLGLLAIHFATAWLDDAVFWSWELASWQRAWALAASVVILNLAAWTMLRRLDSRMVNA
jgi:hypothetical protein